jgi:hypothetical protein
MIDRSKLVLPAFLDTVLQIPVGHLNPIFKFYSLFVRHFVISDTQALDNRFFQRKPVVSNLQYLFEECAYDGLPLVMVLKRRPTGFEELLMSDMLRVNAPDQHAMDLSSLDSIGRRELSRLRSEKRLTSEALAYDVKYPLAVLKKLDKHVSSADYEKALGTASFVQDADRYRSLFYSLLKLPALHVQFGLKTKQAEGLLTKLAVDDPGGLFSVSYGLSSSQRMGRTHVYRWRKRMRSMRGAGNELKNLSDSDFGNILNGIISCADYVYMRNFSDSTRTSLMIDNMHWLPSSAVNETFSGEMSYVERADDAIEYLLDVKDGYFNGYGSEYLLSIREKLDDSGFTKAATWKKIAALRSQKSFHRHLEDIEDALQKGDSYGASDLMRHHVVDCFQKLVRRPTYSWLDLFPAVVQGGKEALKIESQDAAIGVFAAATESAICLLPIAGRGLKYRRQLALIDSAAASVCDMLLKRP